MRSDFKIVKSAGHDERRWPVIDPRHEEPPHGDFPWPHVPDPIKRVMKERSDAWKFVFTSCGITVVILAAAWMIWTVMDVLSTLVMLP